MADDIDFNAIEKRGGETFTIAGLDIAEALSRECDNRTPAVFSLQVADAEFARSGELEVVENQIRAVLKHFKNANKKKSPQSAWKPVYASLEGLTIFLKTNTAWFDSNERARAHEVFKTFGAAWIATAEKLAALGSFNENSYPSIRSVIAIALATGHALNERAGKKISHWPEKLESLWTGTEFDGESKKKSSGNGGDDSGKKKKKGRGEVSDDEADKKKSKKKDATPASPWDFEAAFSILKGSRKQVGGSEYDISLWSQEQKDKVARAAA